MLSAATYALAIRSIELSDGWQARVGVPSVRMISGRSHGRCPVPDIRFADHHPGQQARRAPLTLNLASRRWRPGRVACPRRTPHMDPQWTGPGPQSTGAPVEIPTGQHRSGRCVDLVGRANGAPVDGRAEVLEP